MSLRLNSTTAYAQLTGAAAMGNSAVGTLLAWVRPEVATSGRELMMMSRPGRAVGFRVSDASNLTGFVSGGSSATYASATNVWIPLITQYDATSSDYVTKVYAGGSITTVYTYNIYNDTNLATIRFGNNDAYGDTAQCSIRYARYWSRLLSNAELIDECEMTPSSGTPAASTTNLRGSWGLPDATTGTDWSGNGNTLTISGGATSSEEPTIGGGAAVFIPTQYQRTNSLLRM